MTIEPISDDDLEQLRLNVMADTSLGVLFPVRKDMIYAILARVDAERRKARTAVNDRIDAQKRVVHESELAKAMTRERDEARAALDREKARADAMEERCAAQLRDVIDRGYDDELVRIARARDDALEDAAQVLDASARIARKEADDTRLFSVDARIRRDRAAFLESHVAAIRAMKGARP